MSKAAAKKRQRTVEIIRLLTEEFPDSRCSLHYTNPLELLIATILSAQSTDVLVNKVTPALFNKYKTARDYAAVLHEELADDIRSTGYYNQKAKNIQTCCSIIDETYKGDVPDTIDELVKLPGVGRKTANVVLGCVFNTPGIVVDTHVKRLAGRLALSDKKAPDKIEIDLNNFVPREEWTHFSHLLVDHGRKYCQARKPQCAECPISSLCPSNELPVT
ncbi:endonuclease III [candidate division KSB1 bacterium]